jgi:aminopeptidase N
LVVAKETIMRAVNAAFRDELVELFHSLDTYRTPDSPKDGIEDRILKGVLLGLISVDDTPDSHRLILDHYHKAVTASDRVAALTALNRSSSPERRDVLDAVYEAWHPHLSGYANYLRVVSYGTQPDVFDMIRTEQERHTFDVNQPTWSRALFLTFAANTKMVWTDEGVDWVRDKVIWLSRINDYTAGRLLNTFQHCRQLKPNLKGPVTAALETILKDVPAEVSPTIHGQAKAYLG